MSYSQLCNRSVARLDAPVLDTLMHTSTPEVIADMGVETAAAPPPLSIEGNGLRYTLPSDDVSCSVNLLSRDDPTITEGKGGGSPSRPSMRRRA